MNRYGMCVALSLLAAVASLVRAAPGIAPTEALPPEEQRSKFHLPPGFEIQLVVADPDIGQPMNLNFDARGRLWITHSVEYPYPARGDVEPRIRFPGVGDHDPRDRLTVVEGIGPDGRPAKITHFIPGGLNIPIGNTPLGDGSAALVYSIPNIYRAIDTDGDGQADQQDVLFGKFGNIDTHGMINGLTRWIDGWIYGCHGFANTSTVRDAAGREVTMNSGNTYRFRADGTRFEQFTWGQVNPFGLTFDPWGDAYDADCHSMPIYMLLRGAYYPSFGKPHDGLDFGPTMIDHGHGSTGICGPAYYAADHFPAEFRGSVFICNPVNCQVHHDRLKQVGSTFLVDTQPDFITCDDGWFRPVDVAVGPDGALYVADFYNCIIGHYEVPLDHPRRDRTHGRVWRVVYKGAAGQAPPPRPMPDLTKLELEPLIARLSDPNLVVRTLATNWLVDRTTAADAADPAPSRDDASSVCAAVGAAMFDKASTPELRAHGLWVLERLQGLSDDAARRLAGDVSPLVRTHVIRALAEREQWSDKETTLVHAALADENPIVRRVAADAAGRHAGPQHLRPLLDLLASADPADTHLVHVARMALRDQLRDPPTLATILKSRLDEADVRTLAELALSVPTPAAADLVLSYLDRFGGGEPKAAEYVAFAGEYLRAESVATLVRVVRQHFADDLEFQFRQLQSVRTGLDRRGVERVAAVDRWAHELTATLLAAPSPAAIAWSFIPASNPAVPGNPWVRQQRPSADGVNDATFWSSLPHGERLTGTLRSDPFELPAEFSFFIAGHNGPTNQPESPRNFVRLRDAETGKLLAEAKPPRNDAAQQVRWKLQNVDRRRGYLELIDNFDATGFAWLAVGRFSLAPLNGDRFQPRDAAFTLISRFRLSDFRPQLEQIARDADLQLDQRRRAAETLTAFAPDARLSAMLGFLADSPPDATLDQRVLHVSLGRDDKQIAETLADVMLRAPRTAQRRLAATLSGDAHGGQALLQLVAAGKAAPRLLTDPLIRSRLTSLKIPDVEQRIDALTAKLPPANDELLQLIDQRREQFADVDASVDHGQKVFTKICAGCHQIDGQGSQVGPQLDGVGGRGLARIIEDVLDPNRNVDPTFRTTTLALADGQVVTGLVRRGEGATLVLADNQGKEFTVAKNEIDQQTLGTLSLMPANFGETISAGDFHDLIAYLLSRRPRADQ